MPWRFGFWDDDALLSAPTKGYTPVENFTQGIFRGFSVEGGRDFERFEYVGMKAYITVQGLTEARAEQLFPVGQPIAIRWDDADPAKGKHWSVRKWPKGPPCVFAGYVNHVETDFIPGGRRQAHSITTIEADDWMGEWWLHTPWQELTQANLESGLAGIVFRTRNVRVASEGVRLDQTWDFNIAHHEGMIEELRGRKVGEVIPKAAETVGGEVFMRHGERLGSRGGDALPPAENDPRVRWYIRRPQMVVRQIGQGSTFEAGHILLAADGSGATALPQQTLNGAPIQKRFRPDDPELTPIRVHHPARTKVRLPRPLDRVTLVGLVGPGTEEDDQGNQVEVAHTAEAKHILTRWERLAINRPGLYARNSEGGRAVLDAAAQRFLDNNTNENKIYTTDIPSLSDEEIDYWASLGLADEVVLQPPDGVAQTAPISEVRFIRWEAEANGGQTSLQMQTVHARQPIPFDPGFAPGGTLRALWSTEITWERSGQLGGWDEGLYGDITDRTAELPDGTVRFTEIARETDGSINIAVETVGEYDILEGLWAQFEFPTTTIVYQIPVSGSDEQTSAANILPDSLRPPEGETTVVFSIFATDPRVLPAMPEPLPTPPEPGDPEAPPEPDPEPPPDPDPIRVWLSGLTWGEGSTGEGFGAGFGRLADPTFIPDSLSVVVASIQALNTPAGSLGIEVGTPEQYDELEGLWLRIELPTGNKVVPIPASTGSSGQVASVFTAADLPPLGTQVAVSIWDSDPTDEPNTPGFPIDPADAVWNATLTWGSAADARGFGTGYGTLSDATVDTDDDNTDDATIAGIDVSAAGALRLSASTNDGYDALEGLWLRVELPARDVLVQVPAGTGRSFATADGYIDDAHIPIDGTQIAVSLYDGEPLQPLATPGFPVLPAVAKLWSATLTWGTDISGTLQGWRSAFGSISDTTIDFNGDGTDDVTLTSLYRNSAGDMRILGTGSLAYWMNRKWVRIEPTDDSADDVIHQIDTTSGIIASLGGWPEASRPRIDGSQIAVSVWNRDPTGQPATTGLPIVPTPVKLWESVITWGTDTGDDPDTGWRAGDFGDIDDTTIDFDDDNTDDVTLTAIYADASDNSAGIRAASVAGFDELEGKWLRIEFPTLDWTGRIRESGTQVAVYPRFPDSAVPGANVRVPVSIWSHDPEGQPASQAPTPTPTPQKLRDMVLTWGDHPDDNIPRHGFSLAPPESAGNAYGGLTNNTVTIGSTVVTIRRLAELGNPGDDNEGQVRIDVGNHDQAEALAGNWIRIEPTTSTAGDVIFQVPEPEGTDDHMVTDLDPAPFPAANLPADTTRIAVSIWDLQPPAGEAPTPNLPRVNVPDLDPLTETEARAAILAAGLVVGDVDSEVTNTQSLDDQVVDDSQSPDAGEPVLPGSTVTFTSYMYEAPAPAPMPVWTATMTGTTEGAWWGYDNRAGENDNSALSDTVAEDIGDNDVDVTIIHIDINDNIGGGQARMRIWTETAAQMNAIEGMYLRIELTDDIADDLIAAIPPSNTRANIDIDNLTQADIPADLTQVAVSIWDGQPPDDRVSTAGHPIAPVTVPDLIGDDIDDVETEIAGLNLVLVQSFTNTQVETNVDDTVATQDPAANTVVVPGSTVTVTVWNRQVALPNLISQPRNVAEGQLTGLGLVVEFATGPETSNADLENDVQSMEPGPGMEVDVGSTVTLTIWDYQAPVPTATPLWSGVLVWGDHPNVNLPRTGYSHHDIESGIDDGYGALAPSSGRRTLDDYTTVDIDGTSVTLAAIRRLDSGAVRIDVGDHSTQAQETTELDALEGKWLRIELPNSMADAAIFQVPVEPGDNAASEAGVIDDTEHATIGRGTQLAVSVWENDPTGQPATTGLPVKLPVGGVTAAAIFVGEDGGWFGWSDHPSVPLDDFGTAVPRDTGYPWQFNHGGHSVQIIRLDMRSNRRVRIVAADSADFDAIEGLWLRLDLPNVTDPVVSQIPASTNDRTPSSWRPLPENPDVPAAGEVFMASLWTTQAAADAG